MNDSQPKRFAIALSYPGERQEYVGQVADHLAKAVTWERVLYDKYLEEDFAKFDLDVKLPNLYLKQSELIVVFLCPECLKKRWCRLELRYIRQMIGTQDQDRIMLVSFGDPGDLSEFGILPGDGFMDIGNRPPEVIAGLILRRAGTQKLPPASTQSVELPARRAGNLRHANPEFRRARRRVAEAFHCRPCRQNRRRCSRTRCWRDG